MHTYIHPNFHHHHLQYIVLHLTGEWTSRIVHLLNDQHMGVVTAAASLIDALVKKNPDEYKVNY